jgi:hypothetical protein
MPIIKKRYMIYSIYTMSLELYNNREAVMLYKNKLEHSAMFVSF